MNRLTSLTISIDYALSKSSWKKDIPSLVSSSPLERFELYYYTAIIRDPKEIQLDDLVTTLISTHGPRLMRFSIHRLPISLKALYDVCTEFTNLEHLFVSVEEKDLVSACLRIRPAVHQFVSGTYRKLVIESHKTPGGPPQFREHTNT